MHKLSMATGVAVLALLVPVASASALTQWDQSNDGLSTGYSVNTEQVSQDFTPTLSSVDDVQLCLGGDAATTEVQIVGTDDLGQPVVLGTSDSQTLPANPSGFTVPPVVEDFTFASPVALTPGQTYSIQTVPVSGTAFAYRVADLNDPMGAGPSFWFREGAAAADPTQASVAAPVCA